MLVWLARNQQLFSISHERDFPRLLMSKTNHICIQQQVKLKCSLVLIEANQLA
jgi:hypothetical protein